MLGYRSNYDQPQRLSTLKTLGYYCHDFAHYLLNRRRHRRMEQKTIDQLLSEDDPDPQAKTQTKGGLSRGTLSAPCRP